MCQPCTHLNQIGCIPPTGRIASNQLIATLFELVPGIFRRIAGNLSRFFRRKGTEIDLHAPGAQRRRQFFWPTGRCCNQTEIRWKAVFKDIVDVAWDVTIAL